MLAKAPSLVQRLEAWRRALARHAGPDWAALERHWLDALLEFDRGEIAQLLDGFGGPIRRRDKEALAREIERAIRFLHDRRTDPLLTISWR